MRPDPPSPAPAPASVAAEPSGGPVEALSEEQGRRIDFIWSLGMVGLLGLGFLVLMAFRGVAVPVLLAVAIAYVLNPVVSALARRGLARSGGSAAVFGAGALLFAGFVLYLIPVFRDEAAKLPDFFTRASTQVVPWVEGRFGVSVPELVRERTAQLGGEAAQLLKSAGPTLARVATAFAGNTARFVATVLGLLVVPVLAFFFLKDYPLIVERAKGLLPRRAVGLLARRFAEVDQVLSAFVRGQLTVGAILSVLYATGLSIARVDMAILIGLIAGFGNMVPYLGTMVGVGLALIGLVLSWQGPWQLAVVVLTFGVAQLSEGLVITPRIVGEKVGLPPVAVIIAVLAFGELFGFVGILLAVPTSAILKVVLRVVLERYRRTRLYLGEASAP